MAEDQRGKRWRDLYRLVLIKDETLEAVGSFRLSLLNLYILISSILVVTTLIVVLIVFFTPVKRLVPGYADIHENREYMELYNKLQKLQEQVEAQRLYTESFRKLIGEGRTDSISDEAPSMPVSPDPVGYVASDAHEEGTPSGQEVDTPSSGGVKSNRPRSPEIRHLYLIPPVKGPVSAAFAPEINHFGIDVLAARNTPVKAILDGYVITSDWTLETGNTVGIQHAGNIVSFYKHNARNLKPLGAFVKAGEAVAIVGNTGELTSGPHLHFELWLDGKPTDPADYIDF